MDIRHLRYFIAIVENNFNLSKTAQNLYISQPTLSMMISDFEQREEIQLFKRSNGKIMGLTYIGENYYHDAKEIIAKYNDMHRNLHNENTELIGNITIGIPPLILSVVFSDVIPSLILNNPTINITVKEQGAFALKSELLLEQVDLAVLLYPEGISKNIIDSFAIHHSELSLFLSPNHPLANKEKIEWRDLNKQKMAIFDKNFMISHQLKEHFERHNIYPNIVIESGSWDFMLNAVKLNHDLLTILPYPIAEQYQSPEFVCRKINEPILWRVTLCRLKKNNYSTVENYIFDLLLKLFKVK
ncbi:LysR family transcriptional regulator [Rodentibacter caecimuris]|uniref:LysR family transcriptional regulator n=1 Tax=Rodentibacter caecimuris TaxID=1796644 RepID=A0A1V3KEQ3_9PAST|nr:MULTISPECIES: LysR family transcriptional regulator [Pasteurellaceae]AOF53520.1 Transcriptional regulator, LysR family [Pasteurellaceae bacterium NI1060]MCQ9124194.1 LysR family transcriptional regulator [Rodentibacter heylii]MCR1837958.1 LysR family transcriptional regulator [Pasteurella caecimuris]MCU0107456.1 LysR family transcriptional regulator [Pasteurella caecimuris]MCX2961837.1 LysR family transcriptional regulator [Rodentibacter heylii]